MLSCSVSSPCSGQWLTGDDVLVILVVVDLRPLVRVEHVFQGQLVKIEHLAQPGQHVQRAEADGVHSRARGSRRRVAVAGRNPRRRPRSCRRARRRWPRGSWVRCRAAPPGCRVVRPPPRRGVGPPVVCARISPCGSPFHGQADPDRSASRHYHPIGRIRSNADTTATIPARPRISNRNAQLKTHKRIRSRQSSPGFLGLRSLDSSVMGDSVQPSSCARSKRETPAPTHCGALSA